jgi:hypothetical protein
MDAEKKASTKLRARGALWGSQFWLPRALSRRSLNSIPEEPPEKRRWFSFIISLPALTTY